jgi:DNA topoisomerase-1
MRAFWEEFSAAVAQTKDLSISDVIDALDEDLGPALLPRARRRARPAPLPGLQLRAARLRLGRSGAFIGCANYPNAATPAR